MTPSRRPRFAKNYSPERQVDHRRRARHRLLATPAKCRLFAVSLGLLGAAPGFLVILNYGHQPSAASSPPATWPRDSVLERGREKSTLVLYDRDARLAFSGGMTASRGHEGDSHGRSAVTRLVLTGASHRSRAPVYGCPLQSAAPARNGTRAGRFPR